ncbi:hypothetical protein BGW41_003675 [Actinomortierella wolfii]|nr:hypothetical protein BGW41_003675 [Actinomortierella wolfii]
MTQIESVTEHAIRSEQDFNRFISRKPFRARTAAALQLVQEHGIKVLPLVVQLLATEPLVTEIPILQPPEDPASLNADGGDPNPVAVKTPLVYHQTNSSRRFLTRHLGLSMACSLVEVGFKEAMPLLLEQLNHPSSLGKRQLIMALAAHASDDELLAATRDSSQATIDSLVDALIRNSRKPLSYKIRGKPVPVSRTRAAARPLLERFRADLESSEEYKREEVWKKYSELITIRRSKSTTTSPEETDDQIKSSILELQELYPPLLYPWDELRPKQRDPDLADIIGNRLLHFLNYDVQRTMNVLRQTSWRKTGQSSYTLSICSSLWSSNVQDFWNRKQDGSILRDYYKSLLQAANGELVLSASLPSIIIFKNCRTSVVDELARTVLTLLDRGEFDQLPSQLYEKNKCWQRITNILNFVALAIENIAHRSKGCSKSAAKVEPAKVVYDTIFALTRDSLRAAIQAIKRLTHGESELILKLKSTMLDKLLGGYDDDHSKACRAFPPLSLIIFEEIKLFFNVPERLSVPLASIADNLLRSLQPLSESVYDIPNNGAEKPFSSMPPWDNEEVFKATVLAEFERTQGTEAGLYDDNFESRFLNFHSYIKPCQKNIIATWLIESSGLHTVLVKKVSNRHSSLFTSVLSDLELRHRFIYPLIFGDLKAEANLNYCASSWAEYLDIRDAETRAHMVRESFKPAFADRLKWIVAILNATRRCNVVREWIETLKWLLPKIRNEIQPNLILLAPSLEGSDGEIPRQYLDNATLEEAKELVNLYLTMDAQNASAVSPVYQITSFIDKLAAQALNRFVHDPSHPFFQFGAEILWRRTMTRNGTVTALENYYLEITEPWYGYSIYQSRYSSNNRNEEEELQRRILLEQSSRELEERGGARLLPRLPDGQEEAFVQAKLAIFQKRWLEVKNDVMTAKQLEQKEGDDSLEIAQPSLWSDLCRTIINELGWRWERSPTLQRQVKRWMETLQSAKKETYGSEEVLIWDEEEDVLAARQGMEDVFSQYTEKYWLDKNKHKLEIYVKFMDLKLKSDRNWVVVNDQRGVARDKEYEAATGITAGDRYVEWFTLSKSAIHVTEVLDYLSTNRQDLLTDEILSAPTEFRGIFNQTKINSPWDLFISHPEWLTPHQCEILQQRHRSGMLDATRNFASRVRHAEAFIKLPITNIADVAEVLVLPNLPSRITEALLMYLPCLDEPALTLQVLLAPVYLQSFLARTAIHAVDSALKHVHVAKVADFLSPLFPPSGKKPFKVTIQKEALRLSCSSMELFSSEPIQVLVKDLWTRSDFHRDCRLVLIQQLIGLLATEEATEGAYGAACEMAWNFLSEAAKNMVWRKEGITMALLAVTPTPRSNEDSDIYVSHSALKVQYISNTSLSEMAYVTIPKHMVDEYVERILLPMTEDVGEDKLLVESRILAYQTLINTTGWITPCNAATIAKRWGKELIDIPEHVQALQTMLVVGLARCVRPETQNAMENGTKATVAWGALVEHVRELANAFMDTSKSRNERQQYLKRIQGLKLSGCLFLHNTSASRAAGAFVGSDLDLVQPLQDAGIESVLWTEVMGREIAVFKPKPQWTQDMINEEAWRILTRIVAFGNKYLSDFATVKSWISKLFDRADKENMLRAFIGRKVLMPDPVLADWENLDMITLMLLENSTLFELEEISTFIERVATREATMFYRDQHGKLGGILSSELNRHEQLRKKNGNEKYSKLFRKVLQPIVERARRAGWKYGPDANMMRTLINSSATVVFRTFMDLSGEMIHYNIERFHELGVDAYMNHQMISNYASLMNQLLKENCLTPFNNDSYYESKGITPACILLIEAFINGKVTHLDLSAFVSKQHKMSPEVMFAHAFVFEPKRVDPTPDTLSKLRVEKQTKLSIEDMDKYWKGIIEASDGYFNSMQQAIESTPSVAMSPDMLRTYRNLTVALIQRFLRFIVMRPFAYLDFVGLLLTAPNSNQTTQTFAKQMSDALMPVQHPTEQHMSAYLWAPPMELALDMTEYLLRHVRSEAEQEGHREAQMIEQLAAQFLTNWMRDVVKSKSGGVLAKAQGKEAVEALKVRYNKLVDELCQPTSGGYSLALQLPDFEPGMTDEEFEKEFHVDY